MKRIVAFVEQRDGVIKGSSFEVISLANRLANQLNSEFVAVVFGDQIQNIENAGNYGAERIVHFKSPEAVNYSPKTYRDALLELIKKEEIGIILMSSTALVKDLAPRLAVHLDAALVSDCTDISVSGEELEATRPIFAGKAFEVVKAKTPYQIYTIRPNIFPAEKESKQIKIEEIPLATVDQSIVVQEVKKSSGKLDVAEASIVVSGGRGLKEASNFKLIEELAEVLGGAVGASRAVVDAGWRPHSEQVGQTGKTVSPNIYIACGISGAIQHLAGMSSSKTIIAINKDKDAPIFNVADYGIAGDLFEILPELTLQLRKGLSSE